MLEAGKQIVGRFFKNKNYFDLGHLSPQPAISLPRKSTNYFSICFSDKMKISLAFSSEKRGVNMFTYYTCQATTEQF